MFVDPPWGGTDYSSKQKCARAARTGADYASGIWRCLPVPARVGP